MATRQEGAGNDPAFGDAAELRSHDRNPREREAAAAPGRTDGGTTYAADCQKRQPKYSGPDLRLQRQAEALHERGPRPVGELLAEVLDRLPAEDVAWLRGRLERYNRISPEIYAKLGARHFPAPLVREVRR